MQSFLFFKEKNMIRAVFFDVDCTLYSHTLNQIPESTIQAILSLQKKGILVFLATGRHKLEIEQLNLNGIQFDGYITLSGQLCLDHNLNSIYENSLNQEDVDFLKKEFEKKKIPMIFIEQDKMYMNMYTEFAKKAQESINLTLPKIQVDSGKKIYQVTLFDSKEEVYKVSKKLKASKCTGWNSYGSDIIPAAGGKAKGIQEVLKYFQISQKETMAFGDSENDIDMLEFVHIGIAMGNGNSQVKKLADYVTDDIDEDGIYNALVHYGLIK